MSCLRVACFTSVAVWALASACADERLTIGSKAPPIDIEHWISDRKPIESFRDGKVYVIEFWATWCGPCIASMPHLRELQLRYGEDVSVISVSDESRDVIDEFLKRRKDDETFAEITADYWLTTDPDGSVKRDYMQAADQHGIPTAFVVGKTGEIEWIGHPMRIDDPLARIVSNAWDRQAYLKQRDEEVEVRRSMQAVSQKMRQKRYVEAMELLDAMIAKAASDETRQALQNNRRRVVAEAVASQAQDNGGVDIRRLSIGDQVTIPVTGGTAGPLWGDFLYTTDSSVGAAAVHAGLLRVGETKAVKLWIVPSPTGFSAATRNGIQSMAWGRYPAAFIMQPATADAGAVPPGIAAGGGRGAFFGKAIGETLEMKVKGRKTGFVWGTDIYTADSDVATAAVHAGALRDGEEGTVLIAVVTSPEQHAGSERNGVTSRKWGRYPQSFVLQRAGGAAEANEGAQTPSATVRPLAALAVGESMTITVTGADRGVVWGTDQYTGDSRFDVAAVHAGVLRAGERGDVVVTRIAPPSRFQGSLKHGVRSQSWGPFSSAFRIARRPE